MTTWLRPVADGGCELTVHVQPGASTSELAGEHDGALKLRIHARPVEGAANVGVIEFVAGKLGVPLRAVKLLRGEKSRRKTVWVGVPEDRVLSLLLATKRVDS